MKTPHLPTSSKLVSEKQQLHNIFDDLDEKIEQLGRDAITSLIEAVQLSIKNNHKRSMGLLLPKHGSGIEILQLQRSIEEDNLFLSGTVLPKLYQKLDS